MKKIILVVLLALPLLVGAQNTITNSSFSNGSGSGTDGTITLNTLLGSSGSLASAGPPPTVFTSDSLALVALYNSTFGPNWQNKTNWLTGPVNTWYGIVVQNQRVVEINLSGNSFRGGTLPVEIGSLTALKKLGLAGFSLQGGLIAELGNLSALTWLDLNSNRFTGNIPASIGNLTALTNFDLRGSQLSGPLPAEMGNLTQLKTLMKPPSL